MSDSITWSRNAFFGRREWNGMQMITKRTVPKPLFFGPRAMKSRDLFYNIERSHF
jgi:hypothetical protein